MKLLILLLTITVANGRNSCGNQPTGSRINLVTDFVAQLKAKYNVVFVTRAADVIVIEQARLIDERVFIFPLLSSNMNYLKNRRTFKKAIQQLKEMQKKENIPTLYTILECNPRRHKQVINMMQIIRQVDHAAKISVIYEENSDININMFLGVWGKGWLPLSFYNLYILNPMYGEPSGYILYEICQFCNQGKDVIQIIATWKEGTGFNQQLTLEASFKGSFHNTALTMGIEKPYIVPSTLSKWSHVQMKDCVPKRNYLNLGGMLNLKLKFKYAYPRPPFSPFQRRMRTHLAVGIQAFTPDMDIYGGEELMLYSNMKNLDVSANTYYFEGLCMISIEPQKGLQQFSFFQAFPWYSWMITSVTLMVVGILLYVLYKYSSHCKQDRTEVLLYDCIWQTIAIIFWETTQISKPSWPVVTLLFFFMPMAAILVTFSFDYYTAAVTVPKYLNPPIETFDQLLQSEMKILSHNANYTDVINMKLGGSYEGRFITVSQRDGENDIQGILDMMQSYPDKYVYIYIPGIYYNYIDHFNKPQYRKFYNSKDHLPNQYSSFYYRQDFAYKEHFNRKILLLHAMHLVKLNERWINVSVNIAQERYDFTRREDPQYVTLQHMAGVNMICALGYLLAIIVHIISTLKATFLS